VKALGSAQRALEYIDEIPKSNKMRLNKMGAIEFKNVNFEVFFAVFNA
jgi:hypothetical protein